MKLKRVIGLVLAALMVLYTVPLAAAAETVLSAAEEARLLASFDPVWASLDAVESDAMAAGASPKEVTLAVYKAALNCELIDSDSIADLDANGFSFKVNGMACSYDYKVRNTAYTSTVNSNEVKDIAEAVKYGPSSMDVLLVGPYYGSDSNFTNQYANEADSIAQVTGGSVTTLSGSAATGPNIAEAVVDAGVVIYDSHGGAYNGTSYLCLTNGAGLTSEDYSNNWAINGGSWHGIDGRYIENHISGELPCNIFWMAICEGMKASGQGVTGYALLRAGAGCVYGYSQSVTFSGDYVYEATFWSAMKAGATVAEAYDTMTSQHGNWDPAYSSSSGAAWPIVMSPVDDFPTTPDSHQTVYCDWTLFGGSLEPVALEGYTLSSTDVDVYRSFTSTVKFQRTPSNANDYELEWASADPAVVSVSGNNFKVEITGLSVGETEVYCRVYVGGELYSTATIHVNVLYYPTVDEALNVEGGELAFTSPTSAYPWQVFVDSNGNACAKSGNAGVNSSTSTLQLVLHMEAGDSLSFRMKVSSETNYDKLGFYVNGQQNGELISGNGSWQDKSYVAATSGTYTFQWRFTKDVSVASYDDCAYVDDVEYTGTAFAAGDVNGDHSVDANDALTVLRYALHIIDLTPAQLERADFNGDGNVDANDALAIMRSALGIG